MGAAVRSHRSLRDVRCRRPRPRRVLDQRRRRTRFGAGRTDRRRSRVPGRDVHPRRGPAGPAPPRRHRSLATPPGLPGREAGALRIERAPPPRPRAGLGALPRGPAGVMGDRGPHTSPGRPGAGGIAGTASALAAAGPGAPGGHRGGHHGGGQAAVDCGHPHVAPAVRVAPPLRDALLVVAHRGQTRCRPPRRHEPVGAAGTGVPAAAGTGR